MISTALLCRCLRKRWVRRRGSEDELGRRRGAVVSGFIRLMKVVPFSAVSAVGQAAAVGLRRSEERLSLLVMVAVVWVGPLYKFAPLHHTTLFSFVPSASGSLLRSRERLHPNWPRATPSARRRVIPSILADRDVVAMARTGSVKTAAFLEPLLHRLDASPRGLAAAARRNGPKALLIGPTSFRTERRCRARAHARGGRPLPLCC